jgi:hypothetical protein
LENRANPQVRDLRHRNTVMKKLSRIFAVLAVLGGLGFWLAAGANRGWTKNRVEKRTVDEVTGIEAVAFENRFVPGVDFLGGIVVGAGALFGISFLLKKGQKVEFSVGSNE